MEINKNTPYEKLTTGGNICDSGNAVNFKTNDWRSIAPKWFEENCKQCGLCFAVCPDDAIPVTKEQKRLDFNYDACKGCGICSKCCPFKAITMEGE